MKVTEADRAKKVCFSTLKNGSLFRYEDDYFIKIDTADTDGANCVYLGEGTTHYLDDYDEVELIEKYEFIINE